MSGRFRRTVYIRSRNVIKYGLPKSVTYVPPCEIRRVHFSFRYQDVICNSGKLQIGVFSGANLRFLKIFKHGSERT